MRYFHAAAPILLALSVWAHAEEDYIWIEGEKAKTSQLTPHNWYDSVKKNMLSGGAWASNFDKGREGWAEYEFDVPADAEYHFYVRANPVAGPSLGYTLNGAAEVKIDLEKNTDNINIASNDQPDMRFIAWIKAGSVSLKKGTNTIKFRMWGKNSNHGGLDCFVFTKKPWSPSGAAKPGQKLGQAVPGTWAFEPDADTYDKPSPIDLRGLNEKVAGESGWIKRTPEGDFALGNGKPERFWAAVTGVQTRPDIEDLKAHAKHIAKRGINMVRFHAAIEPKGKNAKITDVDLETVDQLHKLVSAMKQEGIYVTFNPYWATTNNVNPNWGLKGHPNGAPFGMLFWDEDFQAGYKSWIKEVFTRENPYTKIPLGKDPAFAIFLTQNEDSMLFWTIGQLKDRPEEARRLGEKYGAWLLKKYGSWDKVKEAWQGAPGVQSGKDDFANNTAGFVGMWEYNASATGGKLNRPADQLQFFSETMHTFNAMIEDYIHKDLGCPILVCAGNWRTANQTLMLDAERWSYTANDVIGSNNYVNGGEHINPTEGHKAGYLVSKGDFYEDDSALLKPRRIPTNRKLVVGSPFIITESTWVSPLRYQSEGPLLVAAYSSLTGFDSYYWFALGEVGYDRTLNKWQAANPAIMGGWPGAALLFRKGYVKRGDAAVHEERKLDDIWNLKSTVLAEEESYDPNRDSGAFPKESSVKQGTHPLAYLVGPVEVVYGGDPAKSKVLDMAKYIDDGAKTVKSDTGELELNYGSGIFRLNAPKAQGACGFLAKGGAIDLGAINIDSKNEYATLLAVPLDDKDLKDSQKIFLQVTTICRPYGWKDEAAEYHSKDHNFKGRKVIDTGSPPWNVWNTEATVTIKNAKIKKATLLDSNGYPVEELKGEAAGGSYKLALPANAMYVLFE